MKLGVLSLKNNICLAPMAGITDLVFRSLAREYGCGLCFTEMVSANGIVRHMQKTFRYMESSRDDKPLGIQIFGADPDVLADAARIVTDHGADLVDINMGCPVKKVIKTGAGAALMKEPGRVAAIIEKVRNAVAVPLTVKIRAGWDQSAVNAVEIAAIAEDCGVDAVILHPRTARQGFNGRADWDLIARVKHSVSIPVIGSGDVRTPDDSLKMIAETGCDGVMIGRAALGNPWIFRSTLVGLAGKSYDPPTLEEREALIHRHLEMNIGYFGNTVGARTFRKHLLWYTKGLRNGAQFRQHAVAIREKELLLAELHDFFRTLGDPCDTVE
jgi:tRNA-dihydrouridine synthase B